MMGPSTICFNGVERFKAETGIDYVSFEVTTLPSGRVAAPPLRARAILGIGFARQTPRWPLPPIS